MPDYIEKLHHARQEGKDKLKALADFVDKRLPKLIDAISKIAEDTACPASLAVRRFNNNNKGYGDVSVEVYKPCTQWQRIIGSAHDELCGVVRVQWGITDCPNTSSVTIGKHFQIGLHSDNSDLHKSDEEILRPIQQFFQETAINYVKTHP